MLRVLVLVKECATVLLPPARTKLYDWLRSLRNRCFLTYSTFLIIVQKKPLILYIHQFCPKLSKDNHNMIKANKYIFHTGKNKKKKQLLAVYRMLKQYNNVGHQKSRNNVFYDFICQISQGLYFLLSCKSIVYCSCHANY